MVMMKRLSALFGGKLWMIAVLILVAIGAFLRLHLIYETATFLGDQGRDAIVMRNIATLRDLPALGPITSVGSIYLGPLYYYMMAPWLWLSIFNPIGPAVGIALITSAALFLQYIAVKEMVNKQTALLSVAFATFSWVLVEYSRFSWNPNLLPQTTLFVAYTLYKIVKTKKLRYFILHGILLSLAIQLHYLAVFLLPVTIVVLLFNDINDLPAGKQERKDPLLLHIGNSLTLGASFVLPLAPFLLFEVIHSFPNFRSILHFSSTNSGSSNTPFNNELFTSLQNTVQFATQYNFTGWWVIFIGLLLFVVFIYTLKKGEKISYLVGSLLVMIIGVSFYRGPKYAHYVGGTYLLLYVTASYLLVKLGRFNAYLGGLLIALTLGVFLNLNVQKYYFLREKDHQNQIDKAYQIALTIISMKPTETFTLTSSPDAYADYPYRYFLDVLNKKPISKEADSYSPSNSLFVVCEAQCNPMSDPQWAIAHFNPKKIEATKTISAYPWLKVYKLTK
ncbi:MAG: glycosyltransferase family 39 protein [Microgenomates group bacterium]|jgi:4-amino-4-deoxy-L-arabinose transferase-like glycosyltransferase